jgi:hypothetical protein
LQEFKSDDLIRIDNVDYNTKFFILRAKRVHNGKYTIIAKNSVGEDKVDFDIAVLGKYICSSQPSICEYNDFI